MPKALYLRTYIVWSPVLRTVTLVPLTTHCGFSCGCAPFALGAAGIGVGVDAAWAAVGARMAAPRRLSGCPRCCTLVAIMSRNLRAKQRPPLLPWPVRGCLPALPGRWR